MAMKAYRASMRIGFWLFASGTLAGLWPMPADGATIYVNQYAAVSGSGASWADATTNLQEALAMAVSNDQIWVAQGTYYPGTNYNDKFQLKPDVGLYGGFAGNEASLDRQKWQKFVTTLSGEIGLATNSDNSRHVVWAVNATNAVIDGFVVTRGHSGSGHISGLASEPGSGLYVQNTPVTVRQCSFTANAAKEGGAIALLNAGATLIRSCRFGANRGDGGGGAIHSRNAAPVVENCVFYDNIAVAGPGGAVSVTSNMTARIRHCSFIGNTASSYGGALYVNNRGTAIVKNSIFWNGNATGDQGGGIHSRQGTTNAAATLVDVRCSDIKGGFVATNANTYAATNITDDPLFMDEAGRDLHLTNSSPCVDVGDAADTVTPDFDGVSRPTGAGVDMGAYEYSTEIPGVVSPVSGFAGTGGGGRITLQWTNPLSTNFSGVLVLLSPTNVTPAGVPGDGILYAPDDFVGNHRVLYSGPGTDAAPGHTSQMVISNLPPAVAYTHLVYAFDRQTNYSASSSAATTTLGLPGPVAGAAALGGDARMEVQWNNSTNTESRGVLVLRQRGAVCTGEPQQTRAYHAGDTISGELVVYAGAGSNAVPGEVSGFMDTGLANGSTYYYRLFAYDSGPNYSEGVDCSAATMALKNITNVTARPLDHYINFRWTNSTEIDIQGVLILRGVSNFASALPVDGSAYAAGEMLGGSEVVYSAAPSNTTPGARSGWNDPAWFSSQVTRYYTFYAYDSARTYARPVVEVPATTLADTTAPDSVEGLTAFPACGYITLTWINPGDMDFRGLLVVRDTRPVTWRPSQGAVYTPGTSVGPVYVVYAGPGNSGAIPGIANDAMDVQSIEDGASYYYRVFVFDEEKNYSSGADALAEAPRPIPMYVKADAAGANNGTTWSNAFTSLQVAVTNWTEGRQIWVAEGVYYPSVGADQFASFTMKANMAIYGGFAGDETSPLGRQWKEHPTYLSGDIGVRGDASDNSDQIVSAPASASGARLDGVIIEQGNGGAVGAGIHIAAPMLVQNCIIQTNSGQTGGMHVELAKAMVRNTVFRGNHGTYRGGALQVYGGAGQDPVFENCLFYDNTQSAAGGAVAVSFGPCVFRNCAFASNSAPNGSCAYVSNYGEPMFYNCILWDSGSQGSGLWANPWDGVYESGALYLYRCLMREDFVPPDPPHFGGSYLGARENCIIGQNPLFVSETGRNYHLQPASPAVDKALSAYTSTDDLDGNIRPGGLAEDIGPYEIPGGRPLTPGFILIVK
jgi:hypothetical protein